MLLWVLLLLFWDKIIILFFKTACLPEKRKEKEIINGLWKHCSGRRVDELQGLGIGRSRSGYILENKYEQNKVKSIFFFNSHVIILKELIMSIIWIWFFPMKNSKTNCKGRAPALFIISKYTTSSIWIFHVDCLREPLLLVLY